MGNTPLMLGVSGMRGIVGESLTPEVATRYAAAFGAWVRVRSGLVPHVVIGRDGRAGGEAIHAAAIKGLLRAGCAVTDIGVATTPTIGVMVDALDAHAGMVVTASHNPAEWNGLKALVRGARGAAVDACAPSAEDAASLIERFRGTEAPVGGSGTTQKNTDAAGTHVRRVAAASEALFAHSRLRPPLGLHAVIDSANASGAAIAQPFLREWCRSVTQLHGDGSGVFPHPPEPTRENLSGAGGLCDAVPGLKSDVGFAQDPDADRLAIIDENGRYIGEEYTLALAAWSVLSATTPSVSLADSRDTSPAGAGEDGPVLCANLSTSRMIDDIAQKFGARVVRTPVGEANVVEAMKREGAVLGGEGNGGVIWPAVTYVRDSLGSMALVLALMARTGKKVSELVAEIDALSGGGYAIEKRKAPIANKAAANPACNAVADAWPNERYDRQDGLRVDWDNAPHGGGAAWLHVRASNTEPVMRLICESGSPEQARSILDDAERAIAGS